ncbi:TetR family transcriptional regulator [Nocardiopsis sp. Huas11]|uniref:TetR/AcrR family transcriptional regulator n=1 Tax=Nocardiopsis sp. Huas11 TaxID=2183912 RepID=UPI000F258F63|nr:TetR/AcrR family transcriptional regulator [Nocardiopsis sp. Huas11]RKS09462.1 TetR family transcriptional regulator [Nocardiopsis sp. Huas11]
MRRTPRRLRSRLRVETLLEAAAQVFEREGLDATTDRIAERTGYSVGTLYQYFPDKHAMLYAPAERHLDQAAQALEDVSERLDRERPDVEGTLRAVAAAMVGLHSDRPRLHALMSAHAPRVPEGVARLDELRAALVAALAAHPVRCGHGGPDPARTAALLVHTADSQLPGVLLGAGDAEEALGRSLLASSSAAR